MKKLELKLDLFLLILAVLMTVMAIVFSAVHITRAVHQGFVAGIFFYIAITVAFLLLAVMQYKEYRLSVKSQANKDLSLRGSLILYDNEKDGVKIVHTDGLTKTSTPADQYTAVPAPKADNEALVHIYQSL